MGKDELMSKVPDDAVLQIHWDEIVAGCGICGCPMVSIRPREPKGYRRVVCPTCLADRMDLIRQYSDPDYGVASQAESEKEDQRNARTAGEQSLLKQMIPAESFAGSVVVISNPIRLLRLPPMPDPESVGNQSREECEEGIDRMTDPSAEPTAEERAEHVCDGLKVFFGHDPPHPYGDKTCLICKNIVKEIRAAVEAETGRDAREAETERCANVDPHNIRCPLCGSHPGQRCVNSFLTNMKDPHMARWRAAIRAKPKEEKP